ncbi:MULTISPECIES: ankyrin repeat domain-containing protein [Ehrlichia]|uniref:Ankyrin repeats family protein n=1 Tax=Ehrlichia cf. muris str. EmCRT TaxID=1359167 RepID=A0A0F3NCI2_9RICK|nr:MULTISPECIES: ankyrin repeat domain-containing protein [Ehrlichia]KJV65735.1 ankyrin repeats family protein [Ehrlichia cf. muris str. EmCRT]OUC04234.1 ankyrin [Ehrlichia sp. Wisconsin_h]
MLIVRKMAITQYILPVLLSEILAHDVSFLKTLESLKAEDVLLLKDELGSVFYYLIMSLYDISGIQGNSSSVIKETLKTTLLRAIRQSSIDESQVVGYQATEVREMSGKLKLAYKSISKKVCTTLLNMVGNETSQEETDPEVIQQNKVKHRTEMFKVVIQAIEILANKINIAVAEKKISVQQVSEFLSFSNGFGDANFPQDMMSALVRLYFLTDESECADVSYLLVKTLLMSFSQYKLDAQGRNAMHYAVNMCNILKKENFLCEIIQLLVYERIEIVSEQDNCGNTPMHYVVCAPYVNYMVIRYFAKNAPLILTQQNSHGDTPLHLMSYIYFIGFAKVLSYYNVRYRESVDQHLKSVVTEKMDIPEMRDKVRISKKNRKALMTEMEAYVTEYIQSYQLLLTMVSFEQLCEVKNSLGHTVYDIINANMTNICSRNLEALVQNFSQVSSRLPIYDSRIDSQHTLCVNLCFSDEYKIVGCNRYGHVLYNLTKRIYDLMSCKFAAVSHAKATYEAIKNEYGACKFLFLLVFVLFLSLCVLNVVLGFEVKSIFGLEQSVYRSVLFSVISSVFFAGVSLCCFLYVQYANRIDDEIMNQEEQTIQSILLSHLEIEEIDVAKKMM